MSRSDENFLARWSRRKQAVEAAETPPPEISKSIRPPASDDAANVVEEVPSPQQEGAEAVAAEPLPRIDDLTAGSDLSAFLRKGVPEALKAAALRRMWSLDPAIRDYIGPSEYAWDFNDPELIPGFGLMDADAPMKKLLAQAIGSRQGRPDNMAAALDSAASPSLAPKPEGEGAALPAATEPLPDAPDPSGAADRAASDKHPEVVGGREGMQAATQQAAVPRHGGALPR